MKNRFFFLFFHTNEANNSLSFLQVNFSLFHNKYPFFVTIYKINQIKIDNDILINKTIS
jgi:flagellar assembly factor FliW